MKESDAGAEKKRKPRKTIGVELTTEQYETLRDWGKPEKEDRPVGWFVRKAVEEYITRRKANPAFAEDKVGNEQ